MADAVSLSGMDNVFRNIDQTSEKMQKKINKAINYAGLTCQKVAKQNCPVGTPESTGIKNYHGGRLRQSILVDNTEFMVSVVGTNVYYAIFVELGTVKMRGRPFLRQGFDAGAKQLAEDLKAVLL